MRTVIKNVVFVPLYLLFSVGSASSEINFSNKDMQIVHSSENTTTFAGPCLIRIGNKDFLDEPCNIEISSDSIKIGFETSVSRFPRSKYFAQADYFENNWEINWNNGESRAHYRIGSVLYDNNNCFTTDLGATKICFGRQANNFVRARADTTVSPVVNTVSLDDHEGWWGFSPEGCFDEDNQYRVAIGSFVIGDLGVEFGKGEYSVGLYDAICRIKDPTLFNQTILGESECTFEGEEAVGMTFIFLESEFTRRIFLPNGGTFQVVKCPKLN